VYKDPNVKGLAFRIHGLLINSRTSTWSSRLPANDDGGSDGDNGSHGGDDSSHGGDDGGTPTN
jgi:hypothetical protein